MKTNAEKPDKEAIASVRHKVRLAMSGRAGITVRDFNSPMARRPKPDKGI